MLLKITIQFAQVTDIIVKMLLKITIIMLMSKYNLIRNIVKTYTSYNTLFFHFNLCPKKVRNNISFSYI